MKRRLFQVALIIFLFPILSFNTTSAETLPSAQIIVDGEEVETTYTLQNGRLMVPDLFFKNTGATVNFNEMYQSIAVDRGNIAAFPIGRTYTDYYDQNERKWKRDYLKTTTTKINGTPYIPLRITAEILGMGVSYDPILKRTFIRTHATTEAPKAYGSIPTTTKQIALTFDDGPDDVITPQILNILDEKDVQATFFVLGKQVKRFPQMTKNITKSGHTIANHSFGHPDLSNLYTSNVREQVLSANSIIEEVTGIRPSLFRPPYGSFTRADAQVFKDLGFLNILWSIDTLDWSGKTADEIVETITSQASPGSIVLQHSFDSSELEGTLDALPRIIDRLRERGYEFVTVDAIPSS